ncbi:MAG: hypothetical protein ACI80V_001546 [Rhodothermales bacterium]
MSEQSVYEILESLRASLRAGGIQVEIATSLHRHGFTLYSVHANDKVREMSDPGEVIEYLHGLRDGLELGGADPISMLEKAVRAAQKKGR